VENTLSEATSFYEQLSILFEEVTLRDFELEERKEILTHLELCLKTRLPYCKLHAFGSYLSRLGDKTSDLDITMTGHGKRKEIVSMKNSRFQVQANASFFFQRQAGSPLSMFSLSTSPG